MKTRSSVPTHAHPHTGACCARTPPGHGARFAERLDLASADAALLDVLRREGLLPPAAAAAAAAAAASAGDNGGGEGKESAAPATAAAAPQQPPQQQQKVLIIGFSMGGYIAAAFAAAHPDLIAGCVLSGCAHDTTGLFWYAVGRFADAVYAACSYKTKSGFITG